MTAAGGLYLRRESPYVATLFTTHATVLGRSIAGNGMPLYRDLTTYNADDLARRFGVTAKHSIEKKAAANSDAFLTVSRNYGYRMSLFAGARGRCRDAQRF